MEIVLWLGGIIVLYLAAHGILPVLDRYLDGRRWRRVREQATRRLRSIE